MIKHHYTFCISEGEIKSSDKMFSDFIVEFSKNKYNIYTPRTIINNLNYSSVQFITNWT